MLRIDSPKKAYQLEIDGVVLDLTGIEIYVEIIQNLPGQKAVKSFKSATWSGLESGSELLIDVANNAFVLYFTASELDAAPLGTYDINVWFYVPDNDYPDGKRRRFVQIPDVIVIRND